MEEVLKFSVENGVGAIMLLKNGIWERGCRRGPHSWRPSWRRSMLTTLTVWTTGAMNGAPTTISSITSFDG